MFNPTFFLADFILQTDDLQDHIIICGLDELGRFIHYLNFFSLCSLDENICVDSLCHSVCGSFQLLVHCIFVTCSESEVGILMILVQNFNTVTQ